MAELSDLLPLVREKCSGMPNQQALDQLKKSYRNFCLKSGYVQQTQSVTREADGTVELTSEPNHYVETINIVENDKGQELVKGVDYKVDSSNKVTIAEGYTTVVITFSIVPELPITNGFVANDELLRRWPDEIASGAASLLLMMPGKKWTDVGLSNFYQSSFVQGHREARRARVEANDEHQFQPISTRNFF